MIAKNNLILGGSASCFNLYNLEKQFQELSEAPVDFIHFDVVDGRFNECFILGLPTLQMMRPHTTLPIEVHLAVYEPEKYVKQFVDAGADIITVHPEATKDLMGAFEHIRSFGAKPALAFRSETVATEDMLPAMEQSAYIIKLTVNPGFSGQKIQPAAFEKMLAMRQLMDQHGIGTKIAADGNVNVNTIPLLVKHGAEMLIGGTSGLFLKGKSVKECAESMLQAMDIK